MNNPNHQPRNKRFLEKEGKKISMPFWTEKMAWMLMDMTLAKAKKVVRPLNQLIILKIAKKIKLGLKLVELSAPCL